MDNENSPMAERPNHLPLIGYVVDTLADHFHDLDDTEDALFGYYARVTTDRENGYVTVLHENKDFGVRILITPWRP